MLLELRARDLGVIADLAVVLQPGMTAITGETGAGKTLVVEALQLLTGGRAEASMVRAGCEEAWVEGRFAGSGGQELVLSRAVSSSGRPRAYVDGRMAPVAALAENGRPLVELHGQHAHQSLLRAHGQRAALDQYSGVDLAPVRRAEDAVRSLRGELAALGGDARERARTVDLLRHELAEIEGARITSVDEEAALEAEAAVLADAGALRAVAEHAYALLAGVETSALDRVGAASSAAAKHVPLGGVAGRLAAVAAELDDIASELRHLADGFEEDPARLEQIGERRRVLADLKRKYGDTLADVLDFAAGASSRLADLESAEERGRREGGGGPRSAGESRGGGRRQAPGGGRRAGRRARGPADRPGDAWRAGGGAGRRGPERGRRRALAR